MIVPIGMAYMSVLAPPGQEGRYQSYLNIAIFCGIGCGPVIGGIVSDLLGFESVFYVMAAAELRGFHSGTEKHAGSTGPGKSFGHRVAEESSDDDAEQADGGHPPGPSGDHGHHGTLDGVFTPADDPVHRVRVVCRSVS